MSTMSVLAFAATLVVAVLVSELASRSILSTTVLFLAAGFTLGAGVTNVMPLTTTDPTLVQFVELALVAVLFTDGMQVTVDALRSDWRLPGRALVFGMPLTLVLTALLAHAIAGVSWMAAWLIGAALSPTDPVFARALVGHKAVPERVRRLLNVESGVNDGIALPIVMTLLAVSGARGISPTAALLESAAGVALGAALAFGVVRLERLSVFGASREYRSMAVFAVGLLVFSASKILMVNEFLAMFVAGMTMAASAPEAVRAFQESGNLLAEILKLAAVMAFGSLLSSQAIAGFEVAEWAFAASALLFARPIAFAPSLAMSGLTWRERATVAWFGPKGFASVFFGVLILGSGVPDADRLFRALALAVAMSIVMHSSSDVLVAQWLARAAKRRRH